MSTIRSQIRQRQSRQTEPPVVVHSVSWWCRFRVAAGLLLGLRLHDFRAAGTFMRMHFSDSRLPTRLCRFVGWSLHQMFVEIPDAMQCMSFAQPVSRRPIWLTAENSLSNHPWKDNVRATLSEEADTVVIGAGFTGGSLAYHWSRIAPADRTLVVLEMDDPASGASGRNEGAIVMGRHFATVYETVGKDLSKKKPELSDVERDRLARAFAIAYVKAGHKSADLIEETICKEGFECDYHRAGWVQAREADQQQDLEESVRLSNEAGFDDWQAIPAADASHWTGMNCQSKAGFSKGCGSWHPAKWVWCLLSAAIEQSHVQLFTRTKVERVDDRGELYHVHTSRGVIRARHVVYATEAYSAKLLPILRQKLHAHQTQAAAGDGGPSRMKPRVVISGTKAFWGRHDDTTLFGSDYTRIPFRHAGQNKPSRFITKFFAAHLMQFYGPYQMHVTHEWSGSVGHVDDEYPIVGTIDGKRQFIIAGMCGSGSNVSFGGGRCIVNRILKSNEPDDYPPEFFAPSRVLDPENHPWSRV